MEWSRTAVQRCGSSRSGRFSRERRVGHFGLQAITAAPASLSRIVGHDTSPSTQHHDWSADHRSGDPGFGHLVCLRWRGSILHREPRADSERPRILKYSWGDDMAGSTLPPEIPAVRSALERSHPCLGLNYFFNSCACTTLRFWFDDGELGTLRWAGAAFATALGILAVASCREYQGTLKAFRQLDRNGQPGTAPNGGPAVDVGPAGGCWRPPSGTPRSLILCCAAGLLILALWAGLAGHTTRWQAVEQLRPPELREIQDAVSRMRLRRLQLAIKHLDFPEMWRRFQEKNSVGRIRIDDDEVKVEGRHYDYQLHRYPVPRGWDVYSLAKRGDPVGRMRKKPVQPTPASRSGLETNRVPLASGSGG